MISPSGLSRNLSSMEDEPQYVEMEPAYTSIAEGLASLDRREAEAVAELEAEAQQRIEQMADDPRGQSYFFRLDKKTIIKTEKEYSSCVQKHIPVKIVTYAQAIHEVKAEEARTKNALKQKRKKKQAKASRKKNR